MASTTTQDWESLAALRPLNTYGWSKALFDVFAVRQAARGYAPPQWAGLKFFNVYGPNEEHKGVMRSVVSQIWPDVAAGRTVKLFRSYNPLYAHGGQKRDFVYVRDVAEVVAWLAGHEAVNGVFNLGSGEARSYLDLAEAVFRAAGREPQIEYIEMPKALRDRVPILHAGRHGPVARGGLQRPCHQPRGRRQGLCGAFPQRQRSLSVSPFEPTGEGSGDGMPTVA